LSQPTIKEKEKVNNYKTPIVKTKSGLEKLATQDLMTIGDKFIAKLKENMLQLKKMESDSS
jgi:hypothetical protein